MAEKNGNVVCGNEQTLKSHSKPMKMPSISVLNVFLSRLCNLTRLCNAPSPEVGLFFNI